MIYLKEDDIERAAKQCARMVALPGIDNCILEINFSNIIRSCQSEPPTIFWKLALTAWLFFVVGFIAGVFS